jgi:hypothetical protein
MHDQLEPRLLGCLMGLIFLTVGLALATNFRGFSAWHARRSFESVKRLEGPLSRVPPWSFALRRPLEQRIARQVILTRVIGVVFAVAGAVAIVASLLGHPARTS